MTSQIDPAVCGGVFCMRVSNVRHEDREAEELPARQRDYIS